MDKIKRVDFDATNVMHRIAAVKFLQEGKWDIHFNCKWPSTTVPQTVLIELAKFACANEITNSVKTNECFLLHTHEPKV